MIFPKFFITTEGTFYLQCRYEMKFKNRSSNIRDSNGHNISIVLISTICTLAIITRTDFQRYFGSNLWFCIFSAKIIEEKSRCPCSLAFMLSTVFITFPESWRRRVLTFVLDVRLAYAVCRLLKCSAFVTWSIFLKTRGKYENIVSNSFFAFLIWVVLNELHLLTSRFPIWSM